ncbi:MAG: type II CAAX endopeptidase family protein [Corynebacterium sp.]|nr:type II CAAX endopeptidase family protein [Corynebacterium sp.]
MNALSLPSLRESDGRPIDSVERTPETLAAMRTWRWQITHPAVIWLPALVLIYLCMGVATGILGLVAYYVSEDVPVMLLLVAGVRIAAIVGYGLIVWLERRKPYELRSPMTMSALGLGIGTSLMSLIVGLVYLCGGIELSGMRAEVPWAMLFVVSIAPAVADEILNRGVLFRYLEQIFGTWASLVVSGVMFGVAHLANPRVGFWEFVSITIEAGFLFGLIYILFRSLWLVIGIHIGWNFVRGPVFGSGASHTSGYESWIVSSPAGSTILSGGNVGVEASVIAPLLSLLIIAWLVRVAIQRHAIAAPFWASSTAHSEYRRRVRQRSLQ